MNGLLMLRSFGNIQGLTPDSSELITFIMVRDLNGSPKMKKPGTGRKELKSIMQTRSLLRIA